jgi:hypothetical protein
MKTNIARIDEKQIHITPPGIAIHPHVTTPDTKFNSAGEYKTVLRIDQVPGQAFFTEMQASYDVAYLQICRKLAQEQLPRELPPWETGEDGSVDYKFKLKASGIFEGKSWQNDPPKLYDSQGKLIDPDHRLRIGNGSLIRVKFRFKPWFYGQKAGMSLTLCAVQIMKLNEAADFGFEAVEVADGFVYSGPTKDEDIPF